VRQFLFTSLMSDYFFMNRTGIPTYTDRETAVDMTDFLQAIGTTYRQADSTAGGSVLADLSYGSVTLDFQECGMFQVADPTPYYNDRLKGYLFI
jgi:hypothetical protein